MGFGIACSGKFRQQILKYFPAENQQNIQHFYLNNGSEISNYCLEDLIEMLIRVQLLPFLTLGLENTEQKKFQPFIKQMLH